MARPARADFRELLITEVARQLALGKEINLVQACGSLGISPSMVNHYFKDKRELVNQAWMRIMLAFVTEDYERLNEFGRQDNWEGVRDFIYEVFSAERTKTRTAHIRGLGIGFLETELGEAIQAVQSETTEKWMGLLETYAKAGVINPRVDLWSIAVMFTAIPIGVTAIAGELTISERRNLTDTWVAMLRSVLT
jgi:AcrR family transcriptional regulator